MKVMSDIIACLYKIAEAIKQKKENDENNNNSNNNDNQNNNNKNTFLGFIEPDAIAVYINSESGFRIFKTIKDARDYLGSLNIGNSENIIWLNFNFTPLYADNTLDVKYCVAGGKYRQQNNNNVFPDDSVVFVDNFFETYSFGIFDEPIINNDENINYYQLVENIK